MCVRIGASVFLTRCAVHLVVMCGKMIVHLQGEGEEGGGSRENLKNFDGCGIWGW